MNKDKLPYKKLIVALVGVLLYWILVIWTNLSG